MPPKLVSTSSAVMLLDEILKKKPHCVPFKISPERLASITEMSAHGSTSRSFRRELEIEFSDYLTIITSKEPLIEMTEIGLDNFSVSKHPDLIVKSAAALAILSILYQSKTSIK